jgi:hypothetical protein
MNYKETITQLEAVKNDKLQELILLPFDKLEEMEKEYYTLYKSAEEIGYTEAASVHWAKLSIITEAMTIKQGNEEQAWDYLT